MARIHMPDSRMAGMPRKKSNISGIVSVLMRYRTAILLAVVGICLMLLILFVLKNLLIMLFLIALASVSMIYNRALQLSLGFEFIMLATVLAGIFYGPVIGVIVGILSLFNAEFISGRIEIRTGVSFIGIIVVGIAASFFTPAQVTMAGIALTILYDAIIIPGYVLLGSGPLKSAIFVITHILFNIWVFTSVAPFFASLLKG